jgi:hypothetical protein
VRRWTSIGRARHSRPRAIKAYSDTYRESMQ